MSHQKIFEIWQYLTRTLTVPEFVVWANTAFVFGRFDRRLAEKAAELYQRCKVNDFLVTGGFGKDSSSLQLPEAVFLANRMSQLGVPSGNITIESKASNGGENARLGLDALLAKSQRPASMVVVAHITSARRLTAQLQNEINRRGLTTNLVSVGTNYPFSLDSLRDQREAMGELIRLADYAEKGWLVPQADLPFNLVDWARVELRKIS